MSLTDTRASQLKTPAWSGALHAARRIPRAARATVQRSPPSKRVQTRELVVLVASTAVGGFRVRLRTVTVEKLETISEANDIRVRPPPPETAAVGK